MEKLFGLYLSQSCFDEGNSFPSPLTSICLCASKDESLLKHYAEVFNEADSIRSKISPLSIRESYNVMPIHLL